MHKIQDLFDPSKKLNRTIESVVTFGAKTEQDLSSEIREYVVTDKLHRNYEDVIQDLQTALTIQAKKLVYGYQVSMVLVKVHLPNTLASLSIRVL